MDPSKQEEYDRLYRLLSSLSTKSISDAAPPVKQPVISLQHCTTVSRLPPEFLPRRSAPEVISEEIPAAPLSELHQDDTPLPTSALPDTPPVKQLILPAFTYPEFTILSTYQELHEKKKKITYQCEACLKSFAARDTYDSHTNQSIACQQWKALSKEEKQHPIDRPVYELINELLQQAIGTSDPFQCRYCNMTFVSRGNHHKHLQVAIACNRLAHLTFMRTIANLNPQHKDHV
jgi:hypothetical protein